MSKEKIIEEFKKVKHYLPVNSLAGFEAGYTCLQKENEELGELLKEACELIDNVMLYCNLEGKNGTKGKEFLQRPEVKALLEKDKE